MKTRLQLLSLVLCLCSWSFAAPTFANCEVGAYRIHTVAEYAELDSARTWIFRSSLEDNHLEIRPSASTSEASVQRLAAFLRGPHREQLQIRRGEISCPLAPDVPVRLVREPELLDRWVASFELCSELADPELPRRGPLVFDRDTKTLILPSPLAVAAPSAAPESGTPETAGTLPQRWRERLARLDLQASEAPGAAPITSRDIAGMVEHRIAIGPPASDYAVVILALRLHHLETLLPDDGYLQPASIGGAQAEFPVLFLDAGAEAEPTYIGDGRWCSSYRLSLEAANATGPFLGAVERFAVTGAFDIDHDGRPDLLRVNDQVVYRLGGEKALEVVDWGEGC